MLDTLDRTGGALALPSQATIVTQDAWVDPEKAAAAKKAMETGGGSAPDGGIDPDGSSRIEIGPRTAFLRFLSTHRV